MLPPPRQIEDESAAQYTRNQSIWEGHCQGTQVVIRVSLVSLVALVIHALQHGPRGMDQTDYLHDADVDCPGMTTVSGLMSLVVRTGREK